MIGIASRVIDSRGWGGTIHLRAETESGEGVVGQALSPERDPEIMQKRTLFEQAAVADEVGATAANFAPPAATWLYGLVVRGRTRGVEGFRGEAPLGIGVWLPLVPRPAGFVPLARSRGLNGRAQFFRFDYRRRLCRPLDG
jgi:hypothetical protein